MCVCVCVCVCVFVCVYVCAHMHALNQLSVCVLIINNQCSMNFYTKPPKRVYKRHILFSYMIVLLLLQYSYALKQDQIRSLPKPFFSGLDLCIVDLCHVQQRKGLLSATAIFNWLHIHITYILIFARLTPYPQTCFSPFYCHVDLSLIHI